MPNYFGRLRRWLPVPAGGQGIQLTRWLLLEANRLAATGILMAVTFVSILAAGSVWTFEIRRLLTETEAVQTVLNTFLGGVILLVSIVVSINSIFLSYDITPVGAQESRIEGTIEFRRELDQIVGSDESPTDPASFLQVMAEAIQERAEAMKAVTEDADQELAGDIEAHVESILETADSLEEALNRTEGAEFGILWLGFESDYGSFINRTRNLASRYHDTSVESTDQFDDMIQVFELFATGQEYFKTLYYSREISELSRTLLIISLPSILITAVMILAINAGLLPNIQVFDLSPLLMFVAATFTIALAPYLVLTSYMLRVATVANRTAKIGPFTLRS